MLLDLTDPVMGRVRIGIDVLLGILVVYLLYRYSWRRAIKDPIIWFYTLGCIILVMMQEPLALSIFVSSFVIYRGFKGG